MDASELKDLGLNVGGSGSVRLARGKGCLHCRGTGYFGRTAILEVLPYSEALKKMTGPDADQEHLADKAREEGMVSLRENAIKKLFNGETTYQEVLRVTWGPGMIFHGFSLFCVCKPGAVPAQVAHMKQRCAIFTAVGCRPCPRDGYLFLNW